MNETERELDLMVAELEQENRLMRARIDRLEATQQRTWVGLTIKELQDIFNEPDLPEFVTESVRIIEAKLKEKNT